MEFEQNNPLPGKYSLAPYLQPYHPFLRNRNISPATCEALVVGFLPMSNKTALRGRVVFQIRGGQEYASGGFKKILLGHVGYAICEKQALKDGKYKFNSDFKKNLELYNIDQVLMDKLTKHDCQKNGLILVEDTMAVVNLYENKIYNSVSTFGNTIFLSQIEKLKLIIKHIYPPKLTVMYDNDQAGHEAAQTAVDLLKENSLGVPIHKFDWKAVKVPFLSQTKNAGYLTKDQIQPLRGNKLI